MNRLGKTIILLFVVWFFLIGIAGFGLLTGDTSLLVVAIICLMPVGFVISMLMRQFNPK